MLTFPRTDGWGWNLPKMHAFAKMPHYMLRFGSANNFSGQIGERALKGIVKDPFAKMPHYMLRFGSANNFSGQIGERA